MKLTPLRKNEIFNPLFNIFFQELQYARKEAEVRKYLDELESDRQKKLEFARENKTLRECDCCSNEECLDEDMLPW